MYVSFSAKKGIVFHSLLTHFAYVHIVVFLSTKGQQHSVDDTFVSDIMLWLACSGLSSAMAFTLHCRGAQQLLFQKWPLLFLVAKHEHTIASTSATEHLVVWMDIESLVNRYDALYCYAMDGFFEKANCLSNFWWYVPPFSVTNSLSKLLKILIQSDINKIFNRAVKIVRISLMIVNWQNDESN